MMRDPYTQKRLVRDPMYFNRNSLACMTIWYMRKTEEDYFYRVAPHWMLHKHFKNEGCGRRSAMKLTRWCDRNRKDAQDKCSVGSKLKAIENRCAFLHSHPWDHCTEGTWLNLYRAVHCYGGPEEGGWWYWMFEPVNGKRIDHMSPRLQEEYRLRVNRMYGPPEDDFTYRREYLLARTEDRCPKFPGTRPHWE